MIISYICIITHSIFAEKFYTDETDAKKILTASLGELDETTKTLSYYGDEDYPAGPEIQ